MGDPEFKPQYCPTKKEKKDLGDRDRRILNLRSSGQKVSDTLSQKQQKN
jgi:hypothetical protein